MANNQVQGAQCLAASPRMVAVGGVQGVVRLFSPALTAMVCFIVMERYGGASVLLVPNKQGSLPKPVVKALQRTTLALTGTGHTYPDAQGMLSSE